MVDQAADWILGLLKQWGAAGAIIFALGFVVWKLVARLDALQAKLDDLHEARMADWRDLSKIAENDAVVLASVTTSNESSNRLRETMIRTQEMQAAAVTAAVSALERAREAVRG